jgi:dsRNA-specific ribonuclease
MSIENTLRGEAWVGDAVLALYARRWLLHHTPKRMSDADRQQLFEIFVSNQFLSSFGEPSQVEAAIGRKFEQEGLPAAFSHIEKYLLDPFLKTARKRGYILPAF